ncbi:MAG: ribosome-binding factor A [Flavobacteriales bacterium]|jgi:ribosome-binding factor A
MLWSKKGQLSLLLPPMSSIRQEKVANLVKRELSIIFQQKAGDWFLGRFITVTTVRISPDLSVARAYLSLFTKENKEDIINDIRKESFRIRKELGSKVGKQLRIVPNLMYFLDDSLDYAETIDNLLK